MHPSPINTGVTTLMLFIVNIANVEVGRRQSGQPLLSIRSGLALRPNLLLEILISSPQNPKQIALRAATIFFIADRAMTNDAFVV
jgi:hypothetical protein